MSSIPDCPGEKQELLAVAERHAEFVVISHRHSTSSVAVFSPSEQGSVLFRIFLLCCLGQLSRGRLASSVVILKAFSIGDSVVSKDSVLNPQKVFPIPELKHCCKGKLLSFVSIQWIWRTIYLSSSQ